MEVRDKFLAEHGVCQIPVKNHIDGRDRRPNFIFSVVCSSLRWVGGVGVE